MRTTKKGGRKMYTVISELDSYKQSKRFLALTDAINYLSDLAYDNEYEIIDKKYIAFVANERLKDNEVLLYDTKYDNHNTLISNMLILKI